MSDRWRRWRLYNPDQPVWLTAFESATTASSITIIALTWVARLPTDVYTNVGCVIVSIGWLASAIVHRRRLMRVVSGALIVTCLLGMGAHAFLPPAPMPASRPGHDVTPAPTRRP